MEDICRSKNWVTNLQLQLAITMRFTISSSPKMSHISKYTYIYIFVHVGNLNREVPSAKESWGELM